MCYQFSQSGRDIFISLSDNQCRELYASFVVRVKNYQIVKFEFTNKSLTPVMFGLCSQWVCQLNLNYLKNHIGKKVYTDNNDFEYN